MSQGFFVRNTSVATPFSFGSQYLSRLLLSMLVAFVLISAAAAGTARGETYYVAKTGSNNNTCTYAESPSTPKVTIAAGLACLTAGDTLIVQDGTYNERIAHNQFVSGTASAFTTVKAQNAGKVTLVPPSIGSASSDFGAWFYGKQFIVFDGFVIDGKYLLNVGILINSNGSITSSNLILQNLEVKNVPRSSCLLLTGTPSSNHVTIKHSWWHHCGLDRFHHGLYIAGHSNVIEHNRISNTSGHGLHQFHQSSGGEHNNIMRYNYIHDNVSRCAIIGSGRNQLFHHNICINNGGDGIKIDSGAPTENKVYNNTFYANGSCVVIVSSASNSAIKNNLCLSNTLNTISNGGPGTVLTSNRLSTVTALVENAAAGAFTPRAGSILIDTGTNIAGFSSGKFLDAFPDQGALEFGSGTKPTPAVPNAPVSLQVAP